MSVATHEQRPRFVVVFCIFLNLKRDPDDTYQGAAGVLAQLAIEYRLRRRTL